jgi:anti-anti-sigma factor
MKRQEMATTAGIGRYEDGRADLASPRQTIAAGRTRLARGSGGGDFGPAGVVEREHTLILTGELDSSSANALEAEIERLCEEKVTAITLDLRELAYIDPVGVAVIAFRCRLCMRRGFDFALIPGSRMIHRAFEQAGVAGLLPFHDGSVAPMRAETAVASAHLEDGRVVAPAPQAQTIAPARFGKELAGSALMSALALSHGGQIGAEQ